MNLDITRVRNLLQEFNFKTIFIEELGWSQPAHSGRAYCDTPLQPATDPADRARLRAELDGIIAHLYGLTEEEFAYILTTFPIVPAATKETALQAFKDVGKGLIK